jgi:hypothetical protein
MLSELWIGGIDFAAADNSSRSVVHKGAKVFSQIRGRSSAISAILGFRVVFNSFRDRMETTRTEPLSLAA